MGRLYSNLGVLDTSTIMEKTVVNDTITDDELLSFVRDVNPSGTLDVSCPEFSIRSSAGPSGPAMSSIIHEAKLLPHDLVEALTIFCKEDNEVIDLLRDIRIKPIPDKFIGSDYDQTFRDSIRRITVVEDKELKNRVIAIFDYWSQTVLKPFHKSVMDLLDTIKQDCTFNQMSYREKILNESGPFYSYDLTAATDLMPVKLQVRIISALLSPEQAKA